MEVMFVSLQPWLVDKDKGGLGLSEAMLAN